MCIRDSYWSAAWNAPEGVLPTDYDHWVTFQSCDAVEQGYVIAKTLFESFPTPGQGKICVLEGMLANNSNTARMKGLKKALDEYPGIEVLDDQAGDWETGKALTITENWIAKYGEEMTGIWCACDDMAIGVVQALKAKGLNGKIKTTGVDGTSAAIALVESGDLEMCIRDSLTIGTGACHAPVGGGERTDSPTEVGGHPDTFEVALPRLFAFGFGCGGFVLCEAFMADYVLWMPMCFLSNGFSYPCLLYTSRCV